MNSLYGLQLVNEVLCMRLRSGFMTYNLNFSFHLGVRVCGLMEVALISLAGTGPPSESRCSRRPAPPSRRLKLSRKLCLRCGGESVALLSKPPLMSAERARGVGGSGSGDTGGQASPSGCIPSMQYGSEKPITMINKAINNLFPPHDQKKVNEEPA